MIFEIWKQYLYHIPVTPLGWYSVFVLSPPQEVGQLLAVFSLSHLKYLPDVVYLLSLQVYVASVEDQPSERRPERLYWQENHSHYSAEVAVGTRSPTYWVLFGSGAA